MTTDIATVLIILLTSLVLFLTEVLSVDLVAVLVMVSLMLLEIVPPEAALQGFSNTATLTVAAMFILSAALERTGVISELAKFLSEAVERGMLVAQGALMTGIGFLSWFINNTAAVAIFIPVVLGSSRKAGFPPARLLMPLSFASMFGGVCTLIGTSTNLLVSAIAEDYEMKPIGMFELTKMGLILFLVGLIYMLTVGRALLPSEDRTEDEDDSYADGDFLTDIVLLRESSSVGKTIDEAPLFEDLDFRIVMCYRDEEEIENPDADFILQEGDILTVRCDMVELVRLERREGVVLHTEQQMDIGFHPDEETAIMEAVVAPNSRLIGAKLEGEPFQNSFEALPLAVRHHKSLLHRKMDKITLRAGDAVLLKVLRSRWAEITEDPSFVLISEKNTEESDPTKMPIALSILAAVVGLAAFDVFPIVVTATAGCALMVMTRCLTSEEAYRAVNWRVIFLLAGMLSLGAAMKETGAAKYLADLMVNLTGQYGSTAVLAGLYLLSTLMTQAVSNNATAVILAPIGISTATSMGVDPRPFLMAITFAASTSFLTPIGYQTNTMIYGTGCYTYWDFLRVGGPLNLLFWIISVIFIPVFWSF